MCVRFFSSGGENQKVMEFGNILLGRFRWLLLMWPWLFLLLGVVVMDMAETVCVPASGCDVAYAYYETQANETLHSIGTKFQVTAAEILAANPSMIAISTHTPIASHQPLSIPFKCECIHNQLLHMFKYQVQRADTVEFIANSVFAHLTQLSWIGAWNALPDVNFILSGDNLKIPVKCSCGDPSVSLNYGLFLTYVVVAAGADVTGKLSNLSSEFATSEALLMGYNPSVTWNGSTMDQYAFIPVKDKSGKYPSYSTRLPCNSCTVCGSGAIDAGDKISAAGVLGGVAIGVGGALVFLCLLAVCRHCVAVEQGRRQQEKRIASKLKNMEEADPISKTGYNDAKV